MAETEVKLINGRTVCDDTARKAAKTAQDAAGAIKVPVNTSDLTNDSGFITKAVSDLVNYYTKSQTYTQAEVNALVSAIPKFAISVVDTLPTSKISATTIYLVKSGSGTDLYTEYIYTNGAWEILGSQKIDLTGYATEAWVNAKIADFLTADKLTAAMVTGALGYTPAKSTDVPDVDDTLKISGAAADAAATGQKFTEKADVSTVPNAGSVDGTTLKMQRKTTDGDTTTVEDLFETDLPETGIRYANGTVSEQVILRDLDSGTWVINGYYKFSKNIATSKTATNLLMFVSHLDTYTSVVTMSPNTTAIQYAQINDTATSKSWTSYSLSNIKQWLPTVTTNNDGQVLGVSGGTWAATKLPTTLPNPNALTFTGAASGTYDGSAPVTINIPTVTEGGGTVVATVYMRVSDGYIQYSNDNVTWSNVIAVADLKGEKGDDGKTGPQGPAGDDYILTETDKTEIADLIKTSLSSEEWTFTLDDDSVVTKKVVLA